MTISDNKQQKVNWKAVTVYYVLACLISWPFFWWRDIESESWNAWTVPGFIKTASYMWGPGLSAIICLLLFKNTHNRAITFFGTSVIKSLLFWFVPIIALSVFVLKGANVWVIPLIGFLMILGEELGWRGFLQDAFRPLPPLKRYLLIAILWELWHFTNRMSAGFQPSTFIRIGLFILSMTVISYIMGKLTEKTKSLIIAVTIHGWINIIAEFNSTMTLIIFGCALPFWTYLIWTWDKPFSVKKTTTTNSAL